ncbi:hypothetical protein [Prosthecodimorpha staleyi]|uniref:Sulfotransferase family protein n=1 Tax=Prosthecodimorpha staleyi TaxID=2840188 RepID=A0A947GD48_9HYPH|nr:hypothetical protein [Prosthecodimorpha staleyi]MBT9292143.1 hypothetical protein [Prosthecodimorpha staleyi]
MPRTLYLHIGMPKTGSTSIQESFDAHRAELLAAGINYLDFGPSHSKVFLALFSPKKMKLRTRVTKHLGADTAMTDYSLDDLEQAFTTQLTLPGAGITIASGEMLFRFSKAQCRDLHRFLAPHFDTIRVVAYLREPLSLANSRAQQNVKGARGTLAEMADPAAIRTGRSPLVPHYREHLETWASVFGRDAMILREFNRAQFVGGDLLVDFCHVVGVPDAMHQALAGIWTKTARNAESILILDSYLRRSREGRRPAFAPLRDRLEDVPGSHFSLPEPVLRAVMQAVEEDVAWLRKETGQPFFSDTDPGKIASAAAWSEETRAALAGILGGPVAPIDSSDPVAAQAAIDRLTDQLAATVGPSRKAGSKYDRGRLGPALERIGNLARFVLRRLRRAVRR